MPVGTDGGTMGLPPLPTGMTLMQIVGNPFFPICNPLSNSYAMVTGPPPCPVLGAAGCAGFCSINPTCSTANFAWWTIGFPPPGACFETCYCLP
jgi:hypothetical protein